MTRVEVWAFDHWLPLPDYVTTPEEAVFLGPTQIDHPHYAETYVVPRSFPLRLARCSLCAEVRFHETCVRTGVK